MKVCTSCKEHRDITNFYKNKNTNDGLHHHCKICSKLRDKVRYETESRRLSKRNSEFRRLYGISLEEITKMYSDQSGLCKICNSHVEFFSDLENKKLSFCVDHNHNTGLVRGLLCSSCNRGLGLLKDSPEVLRSAIIYLENSNGREDSA